MFIMGSTSLFLFLHNWWEEPTPIWTIHWWATWTSWLVSAASTWSAILSSCNAYVYSTDKCHHLQVKEMFLLWQFNSNSHHLHDGLKWALLYRRYYAIASTWIAMIHLVNCFVISSWSAQLYGLNPFVTNGPAIIPTMTATTVEMKPS